MSSETRCYSRVRCKMYVYGMWTKVESRGEVSKFGMSTELQTPPKRRSDQCRLLHLLLPHYYIPQDIPPRRLSFARLTTRALLRTQPLLRSPHPWLVRALSSFGVQPFTISTESQDDEHTNPQTSAKHLASEFHWLQEKWRQQTLKAPRNPCASS